MPADERQQLYGELHASDWAARAAAAHKLGDLGDRDATSRLVHTAAHDEHARVRRAAVQALAKLNDPPARAALIAALDDPHDHVRYAATLALKDQPLPEAVPKLLTRLSDPSRKVRGVAASALGRSGDPSAREGLRAALSDSDVSVRWRAAGSLLDLKDTSALPAIRQARNRERRPITFLTLTLILRRLQRLSDAAKDANDQQSAGRSTP